MRARKFSWYNGVGLAAALIFALFPVFWLVSASFKPLLEYGWAPPIWVTSNPTLENYRNVFEPYYNLMGMQKIPSWQALITTAVVAVTATAASVSLGFMAAVAFARYRVGGHGLPLAVLSFRMVPPTVIAIPVAVVGTNVGLTHSMVSLPLVYAAYTVPISTWMLKSYIEQTPVSLEEAALLEGMSRWQAHLRVTLPMVKGGLMATTLFVFILNWSEGVLALALSSGRWVPIPVQIVMKMDSPHVQTALAVLGAAPLVLIGFIIHPHLGRGFTFGMIRR